MSTYGFWDNLTFSQGRSQSTDLQTIRSAIDGCVAVHKTGTEEDRNGVDYRAVLRGGAEVTIDAKTRRKGCSQYWTNGTPEVALEKWSVVPNNGTSGETGWTLCESKEVDLIFFKFHPDDCTSTFLFSYQLLRIAFRNYCNTWYEMFKVDRQRSRRGRQSWYSECVFVPVPTVERAIRDVRRHPLQDADDICPVTADLFD